MVEPGETESLGQQINQSCTDDCRVGIEQKTAQRADFGNSFHRFASQRFTRGQGGGSPGLCSHQAAEPDDSLLAFTMQADQFDFSTRELASKIRGWTEFN